MHGQHIFEDQERLALTVLRHCLMTLEQYSQLDGSGTDEWLLDMVTSINCISPLGAVSTPSLMGPSLRQKRTPDPPALTTRCTLTLRLTHKEPVTLPCWLQWHGLGSQQAKFWSYYGWGIQVQFWPLSAQRFSLPSMTD